MEVVIAKEAALPELRAFIEHHADDTLVDPLTDDKILEDYPQVLKALMLGLLNITDVDKPVLKLKAPILKTDGSADVAEITFITRLTADKQMGLARGVDMQKDSYNYVNKLTAYMCQFPAVAYNAKLGKFDGKAIQQICSLFM